MSDWPKYESHKVVRAAKIVSINNDFDGPEGEFLWVDPGTGVLEQFFPTVPAMMQQAKIGGFVVLYEDGYKSISPAKAFEDGYKSISPAKAFEDGYTKVEDPA